MAALTCLRSVETNLTLTCPSPKSFVCNLPDSGRHVTSVFQGLSLSRSVGRVGENPGNEVETSLILSASSRSVQSVWIFKMDLMSFPALPPFPQSCLTSRHQSRGRVFFKSRTFCYNRSPDTFSFHGSLLFLSSLTRNVSPDENACCLFWISRFRSAFSQGLFVW